MMDYINYNKSKSRREDISMGLIASGKRTRSEVVSHWKQSINGLFLVAFLFALIMLGGGQDGE